MFFIIGGTQQKRESKLSTTTQYCERCHNTEHRILEEQKDWISIFFIPIIPYRTSYISYCPICHNGYNISIDEYRKY